MLVLNFTTWLTEIAVDSLVKWLQLVQYQQKYPTPCKKVTTVGSPLNFYPAALKGSGVLSYPERAGSRADKPR